MPDLHQNTIDLITNAHSCLPRDEYDFIGRYLQTVDSYLARYQQEKEPGSNSTPGAKERISYEGARRCDSSDEAGLQIPHLRRLISTLLLLLKRLLRCAPSLSGQDAPDRIVRVLDGSRR